MENDGIFAGIKTGVNKRITRIKTGFSNFSEKSRRQKAMLLRDFFFDHAMLILLSAAIILIAIISPRFISPSSIVNIISLTAAKLPIALGIGGCIVLSGTDISAGRIVGLTACIGASLLQMSTYVNKMFPNIDTLPIFIVIIGIVLVGALIGLVNGFFVAKFRLHPFIVTLSTQLILYGIILLYLQIGSNGGQTLSGLDPSYTQFVAGAWFKLGSVSVPRYVLYSLLITVIMWVVWNKTVFGRNMFAVGSNEEAARVSGINVFLTIVSVFALAGAMYAVTGFIEGARIGSAASYTGLNYESDAIAACVIGGVSFVGGTGKIGGIVLGVLLLQIIFVGLTFLSVDQNLLYIIKGIIILSACALDMRRYLKKG